MSDPLNRRGLMAAAVALAVLPPVARAATQHHVDIRKLKFKPASLTINIGDTVAWKNHDIAAHTATEVEGLWDTEELKKGDIGRIQFNDAGEFDYFCAYHPTMKGKITVAEA